MNDKELKEHNVTEIEKMETAAGSVVAQILYTLGQNFPETRIKLYDAAPRSVSYELLEGDPDHVRRIGRSLRKNIQDGVITL